MKIPQQAKRVFKGIIFDVYHWEQEMFDGSTETFEMLKRPNTIEIIATQKDNILIGHQSQPNKHDFYSFFGGRAEKGEIPLVTAKRELLEEAGLTTDDWYLFKSFEPYTKIDWQVYVYIARNCVKTSEQKLDAGEKIAVQSVDFDEFLKIVQSENFWGREFAVDIFRMEKNNTLGDFKKLLFP